MSTRTVYTCWRPTTTGRGWVPAEPDRHGQPVEHRTESSAKVAAARLGGIVRVFAEERDIEGRAVPHRVET